MLSSIPEFASDNAMAVTSATAPNLLVQEKTSAQRSEWAQAWRRFRANRLAVVGLIVVVTLVLVALFAGWLAPYDPAFSLRGMRGAPPSAEHWLGTDTNGRDLLSRTIYGARIALMVAIGATLVQVVVGVSIGAIAGYFGGWTDTVLSRSIDTLMAIPVLALLTLLASVLRDKEIPSVLLTVVVIGFTGWARYARVVRADIMSLQSRDFVIAATSSGVRPMRVIFRHMLPNVLSSVIVLASLGIGGIIILEASLSFLGLGVRPPTASWGVILSDGRQFITSYPHIVIAPGVMIVITVLAFNFLGDGLRDALDPKQ
jgi:peptide/nickel transport system permease protein